MQMESIGSHPLDKLVSRVHVCRNTFKTRECILLNVVCQVDELKITRLSGYNDKRSLVMKGFNLHISITLQNIHHLY